MERFRSRLLLLVVVALIGTPVPSKAQPWMTALSPSERENFYEIQRAFNEYWQGRDHTEKGKGWKQFKRWEWFWEQRVYPDGRFPNPMHLYDEHQRYFREHRANGALFTGNWSEMGPSQSPGGYAGLGRLNCVRVHPSDGTIWVGSASGGLWRSSDNGATWSTNTDDFPSLGVTGIAFHPTDPDVVYIATGDGDAGDTYSVGVLKSTNRGQSWNTTGLNWNTSQTRVLNTLLIHPTNPEILIAAGNGIHKTTNGGATWTQVYPGRIFDLEFKPGNPDIVYACDNASRVYRSTNGGDSFTLSSTGLAGNGARVAIAVTEANAEYVYALIAAGNNGFLGLYRSTNSGESWSMRSNSPNLLGWEANGSDAGGQGWYDLCLAASPLNAEEIYTGGVNVWKSTTGGSSWTIATMWYNAGGGIPTIHADQHDLWYVPGTNTLYSGNDGGIYRTTNSGATWQWLGSGLRITQFYRLGLSATTPALLIGGTQDNGSKSLNAGLWRDVLGGDGMECIVDHTNANVMYGSLYYGDIRKSVNGGFSWFSATGGITETGGWVTPYVMHPNDPQILYAGFNNVWKTETGGSFWYSIGGAGGLLSVLAVAPSNPAIIYASAGNGLRRTLDEGASGWTTLPHPPGSGTITYVAVHPTNPYQIWATSSGYSSGNKVFMSADGGASWTNVSGTLPNVPVNSIVYQKNSPDRLYVGTDIGVWYRDLTTSDWVPFSAGLANVIVNELEIQYAAGKIRAATYGRGIWESDLVPNTGVVITPSVPSVEFGRHEVGTGPHTQQVVFTNYGSDTLVISGIAAPSGQFSVVGVPPLPVSLAPLDGITLDILFSPQQPGDAIDSLVVMSNAGNSPTLVVPVRARGVVIGRASAGNLYATASNALVAINPSTGAATTIGPTGTSEVQAITIHPVTQELYTVSSGASLTTVYRTSKDQGDALLVRSFPLAYVRAMAFSPTGELYAGIGQGGTVGQLYRLDIATGNHTFVGTAAGISYASFAFHPITGQLWAGVRPPLSGRDRIYTVNIANGEATLIGATGFTRPTGGLAFDPLGVLFGAIGTPAQANDLITIDTASGAGTLIGSTGLTGLAGLAMRTDSISTSVGPPTDGLPLTTRLEQNYPNPFNPSTRITYSVRSSGFVSLKIYDVLGREVATLVSEEKQPGTHDVAWDGSDASSGVYFYRMTAGEFSATRKLLLMK